MNKNVAQYHLPGMFEFAELYKVFIPLYKNHREYFYDWCEIASIYDAPKGSIWGGGRIGLGDSDTKEILDLLNKNKISARLTFSNCFIKEEHLKDKQCNDLCKLFNKNNKTQNGVIIYSDLLLEHIKKNYPNLYFVSSTTKVLTDFNDLINECNNNDYKYVVPDFRLNKSFDKLNNLTTSQKNKIELLCNECCYIGCKDRKACYENVSLKTLGETDKDFICKAPGGNEGYKFSKAMENPSFISIEDIQNKYLPIGINNFKIEGRGLGSAIILEFILYYLTKPEYQLKVRENIYLDSMLDLF